MFYPVDSLKRGGRFYLCWVADSWPLRFASITHRQLWSQDIRKICDELKEVVINESGRPTNRYSLRLSSQLMRGLVRLYQKKVTVFLSDLCMINANVTKHANKKFNVHEILDLPHRERPQHQVLELPRVTVQEEPEHEPRIEELIQNSGNIVTNIQDITLREAAIPEFQLPPNDGFGEENPEQALRLVGDRSVEVMLAGAGSAAGAGGAAQSSARGPALDDTDAARDRERLAPHELHMERMSDRDVTLFRRSDGEGLLSAADFEKEIPDISDVPIQILEMPVAQEKPQEPTVGIPEIVIEPPRGKPPYVSDTARESLPIELEELEETEPRAKRRRIRGRLIIDKNIKISPSVLRARIENPKVELRCEDSTDDIVDIQVPYDVFMRRPCRAGFKERSNIAQALTRLFIRNLGVVNKPTRIERDSEIEGVMQRSLRSHTRSVLERIEEVEETVQVPQQITEEAIATAIPVQDSLVPPEVDISRNFADVSVGQKEQDIADMLTQKLDTLSQQARKRTSENIAETSPKRQRSDISIRKSHQEMEATIPAVTEAEKEPEIPLTYTGVDKENIPANKQTPIRMSTRDAERSVTAMLQEAGLADISVQQPELTEQSAAATQGKAQRRQGSDSSETPLGSLDRTKVSLGDSEQTTDSRRFIRDQWGLEGTMMKILKCINRGKEAVTVRNLVANGPVISGHKRVIAAKCFTSVLKLKQHGFIKVKKCPDTLEILDIILGTKFY